MTRGFKKGLVSVIMPVFNGQLLIKRALVSILNQTYSNIEIIVVDDCSQDQTISAIKNVIVSNVSSIEITLKKLDVNKGVANARNEGMALAKGEFIAFLDADDSWDENKTQTQIDLFEQNPEAKVVFSSYYRCNLKGDIIKRVKAPPKVTYSQFLKGNVIGNLTGVFRREDLSFIYQKDMKHEDYLMWLEILRNVSFAISVDKPLAFYTVSSGSLSANKISSALWHFKAIFYEIKQVNGNGLVWQFFLSSIYFVCYILKS